MINNVNILVVKFKLKSKFYYYLPKSISIFRLGSSMLNAVKIIDFTYGCAAKIKL